MRTSGREGSGACAAAGICGRASASPVLAPALPGPRTALCLPQRSRHPPAGSPVLRLTSAECPLARSGGKAEHLAHPVLVKLTIQREVSVLESGLHVSSQRKNI